jgi:NitT/TauT family transport system substrate-binding protein
MMRAKTISWLDVTAWLVLASIAAAGMSGRHALAQTQIRVGKAQAQNFCFVPADVGLAAGIFKKHGIDIDIYNFGGSAKLQQGLAADAIDIGLGSGPELVFVAKGAPVLGVAAMADAPWVADLVVLRDSPIKTVADLKGKLVSVSGTQSLSEWLVQELARQQGWGTNGIKTVGLGTMTAQAAALKTHQIDGMLVESSTAYRLEQEGSARILVQFGKLIKDYHTHVIYARRGLIDKNPDAIRAFLAGWFETLAYMRANRDKTIEISARVSDVSPAVAARNYDELMPMFNNTGRFDTKALKVLARSYVEMGSLPKEPDMRTLFTEKFLPEAQ